MSMQMTKSRNSSAKGGCGCGGAGAAGAGGCGCGGNCAGTGNANCGCQPGVMVRPNFFAGQLLTDDDLSALTNYVIGRQRMHNRFLVGSGVSCGLVVSCHPCGGGRVIVQPGYAVDCCGNEIAVPCPVELDINAMVRDLRFRQQGADCTDPCPPEKTKPNKTTPVTHTKPGTTPQMIESPSERVPSAVAGRGRQDPPKVVEQVARRRYCLYLVYCEEPTDLMAPYSQDDACAVTCYPSRIREGFRFELRCPTDEPEPPSVLDRIRCCLDGLGETDKQVGEIERTQAYMHQSRPALLAYEGKQLPPFTDADMVTIQSGLGSLSALLPIEMEEGAKGKSDAVAKAVAAKAVAGMDMEDLRDALDQVQQLGSATARFYLQDDKAREGFSKESDGQLDEALAHNRERLQQLLPAWMDQAQKFPSAVERSLARAVGEQTLKYTDPQLSLEARQDKAAYLYAYGSVSAAKVGMQVGPLLADFRSWLLRRMQACPPTGDCSLVRDAMAIAIPGDAELTLESLAVIDEVLRVMIRYLLDCICSALLPPCPTCDDPAVKLACLEMEGCDVDRICNLERTFLLTEHNLRYWIPLLHKLGEGLERVCCELASRFDKPILHARQNMKDMEDMKDAVQQPVVHHRYFKQGQLASADLAEVSAFPRVSRLAGLSPDAVLAMLNVGESTARITGRDPLVSAWLERGQFERLPGDLVDVSAGASGPLDKASIERKASQASKVSKVSMGGKAQPDKALENRVLEMEAEMDKRLTSTALSQTKVVRDMRKQMEAQAALIKGLEKSLAKLQKGGKS